MCGRFLVAEEDAPAELTDILMAAERHMRRHEPAFTLKRGEIRPGDTAAVIALNRRMTPAAFCMVWGFRREKRLIFNARSETAHQLPMFRDSFRHRRCLIPATAYYEWDHRGEAKAKMRFQPTGQRMMYLCGLYRAEEDPRCPRFTILTRDASADAAPYHHRMPVIAPMSQALAWLCHDTDPAGFLASALERMTVLPAE